MNTKKTSKSSSLEECGVWLDTVELKEKGKLKRRTVRPISKLLNPMAKCGGYSVAVALNFTQTKMQMPKTEQSSITSFFVPKRSDSKNTFEIQNNVPVYSSLSSTADWASTSPPSRAVGTKRKRDDVNLKVLELHITEECPTCISQRSPNRQNAGCMCKNVGKGERAAWQEDTDACLSYPNRNNESKDEQAMDEPDRKKRLIGTSSSPVKADFQCEQSSTCQRSLCKNPWQSQKGKDASYLESWDCVTLNPEAQDALIHHEEPIVGMVNDTTDPFCESIESELALGVWLGVSGRTSTVAKPFLNTAGILPERNRKENTPSSSPSATSCLLSPLSNYRGVEPRSPLKQICVIPQKTSWKRAEEKSIPHTLSQKHNQTEPYCNSFQKQTLKYQLRENEEESLDVPFTQDSEGFRVIAHRGPMTRSLPKAQSNLVCSWEKRKASCETQLEKEREEVLFTEDSQGSIVIKH